MAKKAAEGGETKTISKADAVRAALADGADKPQDGVAFIKAKFGIEMTPAFFSSYKTAEKAKAARGGTGKPGRKPKAAMAAASPMASTNSDGDVLAELEGVKRMVGKYGADKVKRMIDLFG